MSILLQAMKAMQRGVTTRSKASAQAAGNREVSGVQTSGPHKQGTDSEGELVSSAVQTYLRALELLFTAALCVGSLD
jgi:hypothetical protein